MRRLQFQAERFVSKMYQTQKASGDALKCLLECADIDINKVDEHSRTPLHYAAEKGHVQVVLLLLQRQAAWDVLSDTQNTLLHMAAQVSVSVCARADFIETCFSLLAIISFFESLSTNAIKPTWWFCLWEPPN